MPETSKKILIIDDDSQLLETLCDRLQFDGYLVQTAQDPMEGFNLAVSRGPHIILLDVMMPKVSGFEMIKMLKANPNTKNIPVIMVTAKSKLSDTFIAEGADDYVVKPYEYDELKGKIDRLIFIRSGIQ